ncbi:MAG: transglycosylase SLT domain-containing protein [Halioglobus sp.]
MARFLAGYVLLFGLVQLVSLPAAVAVGEEQSQSRQEYQQALSAIKAGQGRDYEKLRSDLDQYPLAIYLDYFKLSGNVRAVRPAQAQSFIVQSQDSPLPNRFLATYLKQAGRDRRWQDFLAVKPDEPNAIELKCYYFRAKYGTGDILAAWEGAERLWVHGSSRPKECDPLFAAWLKAGEISDEVVWARMLKAFNARKRTLLTYVSRKGSDDLKPWSDKLLAVYANPDQIKRHKLPADSPYSADIASEGLAYLARYNPAQALQFWSDYQKNLAFSDEQRQQVEYAIALQSLFAKTQENIPWLEGALARLGDDKLVGIRLRWLLVEQDWQDMGKTLPLLSQEEADEGVWRYWQARIAEKQGRAEEARSALAVLATERGYYGFLAADRLGMPYELNNQPLVLATEQIAPLKEIPAVQRVGELVFHEEERLASSEWYNVLENNDVQRREELAWLASQRGWHNMAINAAAKAKAWDRLDLRFPMPYQDTFTHYASIQKVPSTELMAIARRESAFFPQARSPVGARGLMQVMPATGKQVAASIGRSHTSADLYEIEHNVLLGSAYYKQLLDRYDGNRVFALTAYNAGPHRVDRWRHKPPESVSVEVWVETIPYKETRNYVQAVLSYNVVFQHMLGQERGILTPAELQANY